jgi:N-acyl-D-amino-acid deacylase
LKIFEDPALPMKVRQGVTLEVLGQDGISVAPVRKEAIAETRRQLTGLLGDPQAAPWNWERSAQYVEALRKVKPAQEVRYLVPHGTLRAYVMGPEARRPTEEELSRMCAVLDEELTAGAIGMSTGLIYPPCCYAERDELVALARVVSKHRGPIVVHMRSESDYILDAEREMIDIGKTADCAIHISHWKIAGRENFGRAGEMIGLVEEAQAAGVRITCDQYPYAAGSTVFSAILPPWVHDGGPQAALARLRDPQARARMKADMTAPPPQKWDNFWRWTGPEGITLSDVKTRRELIGKTVAQAAAGKDPLEFALDLLRDENLGVGMVTHSQADAVVDQLMLRPYVNVCTDGLLGGRPHPRAFGSYPRILARHVRERALLTLEEAVRKMTAQAADAMNFQQKGRIEPGKDADLVVFDAARIEDRATFADPTQLSVGVEKVIVGGKVVT